MRSVQLLRRNPACRASEELRPAHQRRADAQAHQGVAGNAGGGGRRRGRQAPHEPGAQGTERNPAGVADLAPGQQPLPAQLLLREAPLFDHGHHVISVNPRYEEVLGQRCYQALKDIPEPVDIVDCFRPARDIPRPARDATDIGAKVAQMQLGIVNETAAALARAADVEVNRCMKIEFARLFGGPGWASVNTKIIVKKFRMFLMTLFLLGICSNGYAQEEAISLPADPLTDEYYQAFRWFYYDSQLLMFEVIGNDTLAFPLEKFSKLSLESQYNVCLVSMDYTQFRPAMMGAAMKLLKGRRLGTLIARIFADLSGISWDFKRELSEEEKGKIRQKLGIFKNEQKLRFGYIKEKSVYCIENRLVKGSVTFAFTEGYASVPMEFRVRDIYRSMVPLIRWFRENLLESEEKDRLRAIVESMERKYSIF